MVRSVEEVVGSGELSPYVQLHSVVVREADVVVVDILEDGQ